MVRIPALLLVLAATAVPAKAEWTARCQGGTVPACYGEACGGSPEEARRRCLEVCPGGDTHSVGTSSCTVPKPTQTPPAKASTGTTTNGTGQ
jgi:hypothetical protein